MGFIFKYTAQVWYLSQLTLLLEIFIYKAKFVLLHRRYISQILSWSLESHWQKLLPSRKKAKEVTEVWCQRALNKENKDL